MKTLKQPPKPSRQRPFDQQLPAPTCSALVGHCLPVHLGPTHTPGICAPATGRSPAIAGLNLQRVSAALQLEEAEGAPVGAPAIPHEPVTSREITREGGEARQFNTADQGAPTAAVRAPGYVEPEMSSAPCMAAPPPAAHTRCQAAPPHAAAASGGVGAQGQRTSTCGPSPRPSPRPPHHGPPGAPTGKPDGRGCWRPGAAGTAC